MEGACGEEGSWSGKGGRVCAARAERLFRWFPVGQKLTAMASNPHGSPHR